jgi:O-methyltransferase
MRERRNNEEGWPSYFGTTFFGVRDEQLFFRALKAAISAIFPNWRRGTFTGDNLFTFGKNLSFLSDERFMAAAAKHAGTEVERSIIWRTAVLCWAARNGLRREGDFVECGCYKGTSARIVADTLDFASLDRTFWL